MKLSDEIFQMIEKTAYVIAPVTETSHMYNDLGYDSLAFICLLLEIEKAYSIKFELSEMDACLKVERLINLVEQKLRGTTHD